MPDTPPEDLALVVESILFVAGRPVQIPFLARVTGAPAEEVLRAVERIAQACHGRGIRIQRTGNTAQMVTAPEAAPYVQAFLGIDENERLTPAVLATLTVIAYKQPITRADIEKILGKSCEWGIAALKARNLITEVGRAPGPGRPYLYGTTLRFLEHFGLEKPEDLPPLPEMEGISQERPSAAPADSGAQA